MQFPAFPFVPIGTKRRRQAARYHIHVVYKCALAKARARALAAPPCAVALVRVLVLAALLCRVGGVGGRGGIIPRRRFCGLWRGCCGVLRVQFSQDFTGVFGQKRFFKVGLELVIRERDGVGQQAFQKPHALAKAFRPVLALLRLLFLNKPFFLLFKLLDLVLDTRDFFGFRLCHVVLCLSDFGMDRIGLID